MVAEAVHQRWRDDVLQAAHAFAPDGLDAALLSAGAPAFELQL